MGEPTAHARLRRVLQKYPEGRKKEYISWVVKQANGNKTKAAEILGIDRVSLWRKLKRYDLNGGT
jgi:transcriptional regulator with PAS, ATPase and Fis domain